MASPGLVATAAIDFGTSGTAAVVILSAQKDSTATPVRIPLDGRGGDASVKSPTAILLGAAAPHPFVAFGNDAFSQMNQARVHGRETEYLLFSEFKMELRPGGLKAGRGDPNSFKVGAANRRGAFKLLIPVVATLEHIKRCVLDHLTRMRGSSVTEAMIS
jgi:hypothetical protein